MYYKHGSFQHEKNTVTMSISHRAGDNVGDFQAKDTVITLEGVLLPSANETLTKKIEALENAYIGSTATATGLYFDDGKETAHVIKATETAAGIGVVELSYPDATAAEYATQRSFRITMEMTNMLVEDVQGTQLQNHSFEESVSISGGIQRIVALEVLSGPPIVQRVASQTPTIVTQSGTAMNRFFWPNPGQPLINQQYLTGRNVTKQSPQRVGAAFQFFTTTWSYTFVGDGFGQPNANNPT